MKKIMVELTCRNCLYQTHKESETLILPNIEKTLKTALLSDTFFTATCPQCHHKIDFLHPCLYIDQQHAYILCIKAKSDWQKRDHDQFFEQRVIKRYVSDHKQIAEKIRILDDGVDDGVVEIIKVTLKKRYPEAIEIHYYDKDDNGIWFEIDLVDKCLHVAITKTSYERLSATVQRLDYDHFYEIDEAWAMQQILVLYSTH